jgi:hypothetical protein
MKFLQNLDKLAKMYDDVQNELGKGKGSSSPNKRGGPARIPLATGTNDPEYAQKAATVSAYTQFVFIRNCMFFYCNSARSLLDVSLHTGVL